MTDTVQSRPRLQRGPHPAAHFQSASSCFSRSHSLHSSSALLSLAIPPSPWSLKCTTPLLTPTHSPSTLRPMLYLKKSNPTSRTTLSPALSELILPLPNHVLISRSPLLCGLTASHLERSPARTKSSFHHSPGPRMGESRW